MALRPLNLINFTELVEKLQQKQICSKNTSKRSYRLLFKFHMVNSKWWYFKKLKDLLTKLNWSLIWSGNSEDIVVDHQNIDALNPFFLKSSKSSLPRKNLTSLSSKSRLISIFFLVCTCDENQSSPRNQTTTAKKKISDLIVTEKLQKALILTVERSASDA